MPLPENSLNVPELDFVKSATVKSELDWLNVMVISAASPDLMRFLSATMDRVGLVVFTPMVTLLSASLPSALVLPAASENLLLKTFTTPSVVLLMLGVNVAVNTLLAAEGLGSLMVPPDTKILFLVKSDDVSDKVKVMVAVAVLPAFTVA